jgi:hypothetical protein
VTLRGNRRGTLLGPQLYFFYLNGRPSGGALGSQCGFAPCMLEIHGDYARITGLRLRGESRSTRSSAPATEAIKVDAVPPGTFFDAATTTQFITTVDHNDISDWGVAAVNVYGPYRMNSDTKPSFTCIATFSGLTKGLPRSV